MACLNTGAAITLVIRKKEDTSYLQKSAAKWKLKDETIEQHHIHIRALPAQTTQDALHMFFPWSTPTFFNNHVISDRSKLCWKRWQQLFSPYCTVTFSSLSPFNMMIYAHAYNKITRLSFQEVLHKVHSSRPVILKFILWRPWMNVQFTPNQNYRCETFPGPRSALGSTGEEEWGLLHHQNMRWKH